MGERQAWGGEEGAGAAQIGLCICAGEAGGAAFWGLCFFSGSMSLEYCLSIFGRSSSRFEESKYIKMITESRLKRLSHLSRIFKFPNACVPFNGNFVEITMLEFQY